MRFLSVCALATLALQAGTPSHADAPERARIVVECAPADVARVTAALRRLPVKVYTMNLVEQDPAATARAAPPRVFSAREALAALYRALGDGPHESLGFLQVTKLLISERQVVVRFVTDDLRALATLRERLASAPWQARVVAGPVTRDDDRLHAQFRVELKSSAAQPIVPSSDGWSMDAMGAEASRAGVAVRRIGAERRIVRGDATLHARDVSLEPTALDRAMRWVHAIDSRPGARTTEFEWRRTGDGAPPAGDVGTVRVRIVTLPAK